MHSNRRACKESKLCPVVLVVKNPSEVQET